MWEVIKDWRMIVLLPMFFASNYFYAYVSPQSMRWLQAKSIYSILLLCLQQGALNVAKFNGRTRALVAVLDGLGAILGAIFIGLLLDKLPYGRRTRGYIGVGTIFLIGVLV
jgi:hypothetical protein